MLENKIHIINALCIVPRVLRSRDEQFIPVRTHIEF